MRRVEKGSRLELYMKLGLTCRRCGHQWIPRGPKLPLRCPATHCRSPYWLRERRRG